MVKKIPQLAAGFSMLEMLVALLILSVGLLGVATLQVRGQQFNQIGYLRTQATFLAYDMMDRIRVNFDDVDSNNNADECSGYVYPASGFADIGPTGTNAPNTTCDIDTGSASCNITQLITYDLDNWFYQLQNTLPEAQAQIQCLDEDTNGDDTYQTTEDTNGNGQLDLIYTITIRWANILDRDDETAMEEQEWKLQLL